MKNWKKCIAAAMAMLVLCGCAPKEQGYSSEPVESTAQTTQATANTEMTENTQATEATAGTEATEPSTPTETAPPATEEATQPTAVTGETEPPAPSEEPTEPKETEPAVTYQEVSETVYVTSSTVNVRKGASSDTKKLGSLSKGDSIKRIGIGDNGWSKVIYKDQEAYISSQYLSTKKPSSSTNTSASYDGLELAKMAVEYLGLEYVSGGNSLKKGTDCSGFTKLIFAEFGITLPRTAAEQSKAGKKVSLKDAKPGDLYAEEYSDKTNYTGHAGIYIGNGYMISAWPNSGVYITSVSEDATFRRIGTNTCTITGEEAIHELEKHLISKGEYGNINRVTYNTEKKDFVIIGSSPLKCGMFDGISISFWGDEVPKGYEKLWDAWKKQYQDGNGCFTLSSRYGYLNGEWYTYDALFQMEIGDEITSDECYGAMDFYGNFWDKKAKITNGLGETVDFTSCP